MKPIGCFKSAVHRDRLYYHLWLSKNLIRDIHLKS